MTAIQNIEQRLNQLRATLAQAERWSAPWMAVWINETHLEAELERRRLGKEGCGCDLCQGCPATSQRQKRVTKVGNDTGRLGRPPVPLSQNRVLELHQEGLGLKRIAEVMGVSHMTIKRRLCGS